MPVSRPLITRPMMRPRAWSEARLGEGDEDLGDDRGATADEGGDQQHREAGQAGDQSERGDRQQHGDQPALLQAVTERDQEEHTDHIADLGESDQAAGGCLADVEDAAQRGQQGLRVVQVGDGHAGGDGEERHQPSRYAVRALAGGGPARRLQVRDVDTGTFLTESGRLASIERLLRCVHAGMSTQLLLVILFLSKLSEYQSSRMETGVDRVTHFRR